MKGTIQEGIEAESLEIVHKKFGADIDLSFEVWEKIFNVLFIIIFMVLWVRCHHNDLKNSVINIIINSFFSQDIWRLKSRLVQGNEGTLWHALNSIGVAGLHFLVCTL